MKQTLLYLVLLFSGFFMQNNAYAQTLQAGDIAFIGYTTDDPDGFTFIALKDLPAGETIYFTDEGWETTVGWNNPFEPHLEWVIPAGTTIGTIVSVVESSVNTFTVTGSTNGVTMLDPSGNAATFALSAGDQVLAYQSSTGARPASPTFISGVHGDYNDTRYDAVTTWNDQVPLNGGSESMLPTGLTNGVDCVSLFPAPGPELDNNKYVGTLTGTASVVRAAINDPTNWSGTDISGIVDITATTYATPNVTPDAAGGTALTDGDIAITRINNDDPDTFSFLILTDIESGTEILFTTEYWGTDVPDGVGGTIPGPTFSNFYFTIQFTATSDISAGEEVHINGDLMAATFSSGGSLGTITSLGPVNPFTGNLFHSGGNGLLVFQGSKASPTFIAGISNETGVSGTSGDSWQTNFSVNDTQLPAGKVNGENGWLGLFPFGTPAEYDNCRYKETALHTGTKEAVMAAIMDVSNWEFDDANPWGESIETFSISSTPACTMTASISSQTDVACNGGATGSLTVTPLNGTAPYTYLWDDGSAQTTATATGLAAGTYEVTVTDANGCTATTSVEVTEPTTFVVSTIVTANVTTCNGGATGTGSITLSGGTAPYTFTFGSTTYSNIPDGTTIPLGGLTAGTYNITATDANACTASSSMTITEPAALSANGVGTNESCTGNDGSINLTVVGGNSPYTYVWSNAATTEDLTGLAPGTYDVTVTDAKGCTATESVTINAATACPTLATVTTDAITVYTTSSFTVGGDVTDNGNVTVTERGIVYSTSANPTTADNTVQMGTGEGVFSQSVSGLSSGVTYYVRAYAINSEGTAYGNEVVFTAPYGVINLVHDATTTQYPTIQQAVDASVTGDMVTLGTGTYIEQVTVTTGITIQGAGTTETIVRSPLAADLTVNGGWKTLKAQDVIAIIGIKTDDASQVTIKDLVVDGFDQGYLPDGTYPDKEAYAFQGIGALNTNLIVDNVNVTGVRELATDFVPAGYLPTDQPSGLNHNEAIFAESAISSGNHTLEVKNSYIEKFQKTAILAWGPTLEVNIHDNTIQGYGQTLYSTGNGIQIASTDRTSLGGANGDRRGTTGIITNNQISGIGVVIPEPGQDGSYLTLGMYGPSAILPYEAGDNFVISNNTITRTPYQSWYNDYISNNGGFSNAAIAVYNSNNASVTGNTISGFDVAIAEEEAVNGSEFNASGNTVSDNRNDYFTAQNNDHIVLGSSAETLTYYASSQGVDLIDNFGVGDRINVVGMEPGSINGELSGTLIVDFTSGTVTAGDGSTVAANSIQVQQNATTTTLFIDTDATEDQAELQLELTGLYELGNFKLDGGFITFAVLPPTASAQAFCDAATVADLEATGIDLKWYDVATGGTALADNTDLSTGTYYVSQTVSGVESDRTSVAVTINPSPVASGVVDSNVSCNGGNDGAVTVNVTGGTGEYSYAWAGMEEVTVTSQGFETTGSWNYLINPAVYDTGGDVWNIIETFAGNIDVASEGTHFFGMRDLNNENGGGNFAHTITFETIDASGYGELTLEFDYNIVGYDTSSGELLEYIVAFDNGTDWENPVALNTDNPHTTSGWETATITVPASANFVRLRLQGTQNGGSDYAGIDNVRLYQPGGAEGPSLSGLSAGTYDVTITDANGCTDEASVTITEPTVLSANAVATNVSCNAGSNGAINLTVTGGTAPYTFVWSNTATTEDLTDLAAGTYDVTVTDANGCTATESVEVTEPAALSASGVAINISCNGGSNGKVDLTVTGGTAPYTFVWSNTATTEDMIGLSAGTYDVTVTDANGCTATESVEVTEPAALSASGVATNISCNGGSNGKVDLTVTGGTAPYTFVWSNTATTEDLSGLSAGTYDVTVTDANGCTATESVEVTEPAALSASGVATNISCNGGSNGKIDLTVTGGTAPYTFVWSNTATTEDLSGLSAGTYDVTVTDANGCTATESVEVTEPTTFVVSTIVTANVTCNGGATGTGSITLSGGTAPYEFTFGSTTYSNVPDGTTIPLGGLTAGTYDVTATDDNGCTASSSMTITEPAALSANITLDNNLTCSDDNNGGATVEVNGGTAPYTYEWDNHATTASVTNLTLGNHSVTITDNNGCTSTKTINIDFDDSTLPVPDVSTLPNISEYCEVNKADVPTPTATDNCSGTLMGTTSTIFPINTQGTTTITWTYEDEKGNKFTQQQDIIVKSSPLSDVSFSDATVTYDGTVHSIEVNGLPSGASASYQNNGQTDAGSYEVTATLNPGTSRCPSTTLTATLTIEKAEQTISFDEIPDKNLETDADFSLTATASSGLPVSYTYSYSADTPPAEVSETGEVSLLTSGTVEITAHQEGNANYSQATPVTRTLTIESSDATIHELTINGEVYNSPDNNIYYLIDCNNNIQSVEINLSSESNANSSESDDFIVNTSAPGIYKKNIEITSQDGSQTENYNITIEKRFSYEDIIVRKFNNVLLINNNPETNGGYHFESFEWYKDGVLIGTDQYYSAGENSSDQLDLDANYSATMTTEEGDVLQTCDFIISKDNVFTMAVSPNPVSAGSSIDVITNFTTEMLDNMTIRVSRLYGSTVLETASGTNKSQINLPATMTSGTYIVTSTADGVKLTGKIIVK